MNNELGRKIKELRTGKGLTQDALAEKLGVSPQAVSKWENGVTAPDIGLLPAISAGFGVTIDDLFELTDEVHFERILNMICVHQVIPPDDFAYAERFLRSRKAVPRALTLLAELHNHKAAEHRAAAAEYALAALAVEPEVKANHVALRDAENGRHADWNFANHHSLIAYYQEFIRKNPGYERGYRYLLDQLIDDGRCPEAREVLEQLNSHYPGYLYQLYGGLIAKAEGDIPKAVALWEQMTSLYPDNWLSWSFRGDGMAKLSRYNDAVLFYEKAFELQPKPRFTDALEAISYIFEIQGKYEEAAAYFESIIELLRDEWQITEGTAIDRSRRDIERLRRLAVQRA
jgi:transcriptional regulator with XRE-family HTH domain